MKRQEDDEFFNEFTVKEHGEALESQAMCLLYGIPSQDSNGLVKYEFPSATTTPPEKQCRRALALLLLHHATFGTQLNPRIVTALASSLLPEGEWQRNYVPRRIVFENLNQRSHMLREAHVAQTVDELRNNMGKSYEEAIDFVAKRIGKSPRHVKRIYSKVNKTFPEMWRWKNLKNLPK
jgi:hypothetical protein